MVMCISHMHPMQAQGQKVFMFTEAKLVFIHLCHLGKGTIIRHKNRTPQKVHTMYVIAIYECFCGKKGCIKYIT